MNPREETGRSAESLARMILPGQPRDDAGPVFAEPWQAQAFALALKLHEAGCFSWKEWSEALGAELAGAAKEILPDDGARYYEQWLSALERLVTAEGLLDPGALRLRRDDREQAYRDTLHGQPVKLRSASGPPARKVPSPVQFRKGRHAPAH